MRATNTTESMALCIKVTSTSSSSRIKLPRTPSYAVLAMSGLLPGVGRPSAGPSMVSTVSPLPSRTKRKRHTPAGCPLPSRGPKVPVKVPAVSEILNCVEPSSDRQEATGIPWSCAFTSSTVATKPVGIAGCRTIRSAMSPVLVPKLSSATSLDKRADNDLADAENVVERTNAASEGLKSSSFGGGKPQAFSFLVPRLLRCQWEGKHDPVRNP
eukprot:CAMPEP_0175191066 /NCGR_PEP_ID=MMETSP0093-20121207/4755_1 /TAXON_ID=311494 /ORGANISM="Alexandrium monilatum, Strain CCMP3105" /LENGTH=212 /DNA_ID=CAMNT_0016483887 /DNA_START=9 /DNA_END=644 /DNA_ORIENTATION=+